MSYPEYPRTLGEAVVKETIDYEERQFQKARAEELSRTGKALGLWRDHTDQTRPHVPGAVSVSLLLVASILFAAGVWVREPWFFQAGGVATAAAFVSWCLSRFVRTRIGASLTSITFYVIGLSAAAVFGFFALTGILDASGLGQLIGFGLGLALAGMVVLKLIKDMTDAFDAGLFIPVIAGGAFWIGFALLIGWKGRALGAW